MPFLYIRERSKKDDLSVLCNRFECGSIGSASDWRQKVYREIFPFCDELPFSGSVCVFDYAVP